MVIAERVSHPTTVLHLVSFAVSNMSLEEKFNSLSIGDEASILEAIKSQGVEKSGFAASIDVLVAKCDSKDDDEALAALATALELAKACPEAEAFTKECLTSCK